MVSSSFIGALSFDRRHPVKSLFAVEGFIEAAFKHCEKVLLNTGLSTRERIFGHSEADDIF